MTPTQPIDTVDNNTSESDATKVVPSDETNKDVQVLPPSGNAMESVTETEIIAGNRDEEEKLFSEGEDDKKADDLEIPEVGRTWTLLFSFGSLVLLSPSLPLVLAL